MFKVKNKGIKTMCLRNIFSLQFTVFNRRDQCFVISRKQLRPFTPSRYTNAEMKISLYIQIHIKIIRSKFRILDRKNSRVIHRKIFIFLKKQVNFYHIQTNTSQSLRVYNSRIPRIKNAKFSGYYFYMNTNIQEDFQICTNVPLMDNVFITEEHLLP